MNSAGVPYGGIALTALIAPLGVGLNAVVPEEAFEIVLNVACLGILSSRATIAAEVITSPAHHGASKAARG
jgi:L-asparagine permease